MAALCTELAVPPEEALRLTTDASAAAIQAEMASPPLLALIADLEAYQVNIDEMGGAAFLEVCYAVVRLLRPEVVLETGVAHGYSSAVILQALAENSRGHLFSVDLPAFRPGTPDQTGGAVPESLRSRWTLQLGPDRRILPSLVSEIGEIDVFFYDSDKIYAGMLHSWRLAWPHMRSGALLVADDIHLHSAFFEFATEKGVDPVIMAKPSGRKIDRDTSVFHVGIIRKL
jgi:predicted O-methyltransferase YrrM